MAHWRDSFKPARFFIMDARAGVPLILCALHARPWTFGLAFAVIVVFALLERRDLSVPSAFRALRAWAVGDLRPARSAIRTRGVIDYGRRDP